MSKKVLIISSTPRKGGNSDILCDEFAAGAKESGNKVEKVRNPNFPQVLLENASCAYCRGYQYECAAHWYVPVMRDMERAIKAKVSSGKHGGTLAAPRTDYHGTLLATPLQKLAPDSPRTPDAYRKVMLRFAETLENVLPCPPERDNSAANTADEILM